MKGKQTSVSIILNTALIIAAFTFIIYQLFFAIESLPENTTLIPLGSWLHPVLSKILSIVVVALCYLIWFQFIRKYKFIEEMKPGLLPFSLLLLALNPVFLVELENAAALFCLTLAISYILTISNQANVLLPIFSASLALGLSSLFFTPTILMLLFLWISIGILRAFEWRNYVITFVGFGMPFLYLYGIAYLLAIPLPPFQINIDTTVLKDVQMLSSILLYILIVLISLFSISRLFSHQTKMVVHQRKQMQIMAAFILFSLLLFFFSSSVKQTIVFAAFPLMIFYGFMLQQTSRRWIVQFILLLFFAAYLWEAVFDDFPFL